MESSIQNELIKIRPGVEADCSTIMKLIKDLAIYEKMPDQVKITTQDLQRDAFHASPPVVYTLAAELSSPVSSELSLSDTSPLALELETENKRIVGYALYYKSYSTWKGKALHLEDLFVRPEYRNKGIGELFLKYLSQIAVDGDYARLSFECIDWNEPAIKFYRKHGAEDVTAKEHWESYRFRNEALKKMNSQ